MQLKSRLLLVASFVPVGSRVADIGTDHALLAIELINSGGASNVIACDVNEGPLKNARKKILFYKAENIELRLGDGLACVEENEVDIITIAGMGGDSISRIIDNAPWVKSKNKTLILQPMSSAENLREYLYTNGFIIYMEKAVYDTGRLYTAMKVGFTGENQKVSPLNYYIGALADDCGETELEYIKRQYKRLSKCARSIQNVQRKGIEYQRLCKTISELNDIIKRIEENNFKG